MYWFCKTPLKGKRVRYLGYICPIAVSASAVFGIVNNMSQPMKNLVTSKMLLMDLYHAIGVVLPCIVCNNLYPKFINFEHLPLNLFVSATTVLSPFQYFSLESALQRSKAIKGAASIQQMTLSPKLGKAGSITHWHFRPPCRPFPSLHSTVNFLNIRTPKTFVVITLKFELCVSTIE